MIRINRFKLMTRFLIFGLFCYPVLIYGQLGYDPQITAMANSIGAAARGIRAAEVNPALLAIPFSSSSQMSLLSVQANANNNTLSNNDYIRYFTRGKYLTDKDINHILSLVPTEGLRGFSDIKLNLLGLYSNNLAFNFTFLGSGDITLPKSFFQLLFRGNDYNQVYEFTDLKGEAWAGMSTTLSYALKFEPYEVVSMPLLGDMDYWTVGITGKYIYGLYYTNIVTTEGRFITLNNYVNAQMDGVRYESQGGNGYGLDLGGAVSFEDNRYVFSLGFKNLMGGISWNTRNKMITYQGYLDSVSIGNLSDDDLTVNDVDTVAYRSFYTYLPTYLDFGFSFTPNEKMLFTFEYEQNIRSTLGATKKPRFGIGSELKYVPFIPIRLGLSVGGKYGFSIGSGFSLDLGAWVWDFGVANHGGFFGNSAKGLSAATGMTFQW